MGGHSQRVAHVSGDAVDIGHPMPRRGCPSTAPSTGCARSTATNPGTTNCAPKPSITVARPCTPTLRTIQGCSSDRRARHRAVTRNHHSGEEHERTLRPLAALAIASSEYARPTMSDLGTLGGPLGRANRINPSGEIVGFSSTADGPIHATHWYGGTTTDLGTFGGSFSLAAGINGAGDIVGAATYPDGLERGTLAGRPDDGRERPASRRQRLDADDRAWHRRAGRDRRPGRPRRPAPCVPAPALLGGAAMNQQSRVRGEGHVQELRRRAGPRSPRPQLRLSST